MKSVALFAVLFLYVNPSHQIPELTNCTSNFASEHSLLDTCQAITCHGPDSIVSVGCATYQCLPGKYLGYEKQDNSKPYPQCCGGPICAD